MRLERPLYDFTTVRFGPFAEVELIPPDDRSQPDADCRFAAVAGIRWHPLFSGLPSRKRYSYSRAGRQIQKLALEALNMNTSKFERWGGAALVLLLAASALFFGGHALITGEFTFRGLRSNPLAEFKQVGLSACMSGLFLIAVGFTLLVAPFVDVWRSRTFWFAISADFFLFLIAAFLRSTP
jgi:hypothetical protein